jgi:hypothetical protein
MPEINQPNVPQQPGISQDQMKGNLESLMSRVEGKYQDFNSQKFASDNTLKEQKGESLRQVFDLFQSMGIDPSNVEEVGAFLNKIKESNPQLSQQLEKVLSSILGDEVMTPAEGEIPAGGEAPQDNMNININEAPQENI